MIKTLDQKLEELSKELDLYNTITIDELIDAYKNLIVNFRNMRLNEENIRMEAHALGYKHGLEQATEFDYISRSKLKKMSVDELINYLRDYE